MARKSEIKVKNFFVHNDEVKVKEDFTPEEFAAIQQDLMDRFASGFGYVKNTETEKAAPA